MQHRCTTPKQRFPRNQKSDKKEVEESVEADVETDTYTDARINMTKGDSPCILKCSIPSVAQEMIPYWDAKVKEEEGNIMEKSAKPIRNRSMSTDFGLNGKRNATIRDASSTSNEFEDRYDRKIICVPLPLERIVRRGPVCEPSPRTVEKLYDEVYMESPPTPIFNRFPSPPTDSPRVSRAPSDCLGMQAMRLPEPKTFVQPSMRVVERIEKMDIQEAVEIISSVDVSEVISDLTSSTNNLSTFSDGSKDSAQNPPNPIMSMSSMGVDNKFDESTESSENSILSWLRTIDLDEQNVEIKPSVKAGSAPYVPMEIVKAKIDSIKSQSLSETVFTILTTYNQNAYPKQGFNEIQSKSSTGVSSMRSSSTDLNKSPKSDKDLNYSHNPQFQELLRKCSDT